MLALPPAAEARRIEIRVLHTTDLHGFLMPTRDYDGHENVGGLLRCATLMRQLRAERNNVLLLDCGDLYQGSVESFLTGGRVMTRALDALGYDAWTMGNHEFDWGLAKVIQRQSEPAAAVLAANIGTLTGGPSPLRKIRPYIIKEFEGVRVAVVGLTTAGIPTWSLPDQLGDLEFRRSVDALKDIMPEVRAANPDIIILTAHQGYREYGDDRANELNAVATNFPEIDLIIGGHTHKPVERIPMGHAVYTQAGYHGNWLGCVDLAFDTVERKLVAVEPKVHLIGDQYGFDPELASLFKPELEKAERYRQEKVGSARELITSKLDAQGTSPVQMLFCRAIAKAAKAQVVIHGILTETDLKEGDILMRDVWDVVPYENRIGLMQLTAAEITEILNENLARPSAIQFMGVLGLKYETVLSAGGKRVVSKLTLPDGSSLHPRKRVSVAVNSYVLASGGERFPKLREISQRPEVRTKVLDLDTRTCVAQYIRKHSPLTAQALLEGR